MSKKDIEAEKKSRVSWNRLQEWIREEIRGRLQELLEEEVTELLGREAYGRRWKVDASEGYRNGYGKERRLTLSCGTLTLRRPRVRGLAERFVSRILPLCSRRSREVDEAIPELYLHGLAQGDFDLALRGLLGQEAPLSASTVARLKEKWKAEWEAWQRRSLEGLELVYLWVDGIYVKAGLEKTHAAVLVALGALSDGTKVVLSVTSGYRESTESWAEVLRDLKARGWASAKLVIGDGHLGIWGALAQVYPEAAEQRCWNHRLLTVLDKLPKRHQGTAKLLLRQIPYAETREEAERLKRKFQNWCRERDLEEAAQLLERDWERMVTFYDFPQAHWQHLRTTNPVESPFAALRLRTDAAKRFKQVDNAQAVIWKMLLVAEKRFRRLESPELMQAVYLGVKFVNGVRVKEVAREEAA